MATQSSRVSPPAPNERQTIPVVKSDDAARLDRSSELIALFDAASVLKRPVISIWEHNAPGAEYALRLWASARNLTIETGEGGQESSVTFAFRWLRCMDAAGIMGDVDITVYVRVAS